MFIKVRRSGYNKYGEQFCQGYFLMISQIELPNGKLSAPRGHVVYTSMKPCGHYMMGLARKYGQNLILSGAYGSDGLFVHNISPEAHEKGALMPIDVYKKWRKGGGWNNAGSEAFDMFKWGNRLYENRKK